MVNHLYLLPQNVKVPTEVHSSPIVTSGLNNNSFAAFGSDDSDEEDVSEEKQFDVIKFSFVARRYQEPFVFSIP